MNEHRTNTADPTYRWYGVDLDETLAKWNGEANGLLTVGKPIPLMVERVKKWIDEGEVVKIFTARVATKTLMLFGEEREDVVKVIQDWCEEHIGHRLPVTAEKDCGLIELWDDRAVQVEPNTGRRFI